MIRPATKPDWFTISSDLARRIGPAPGLRQYPLAAHRSHLPLLLPQPEVAAALAASRTLVTTHADRDAITNPLGFSLWPHQQVAVDFLEARRGALLADVPRLGKTLSSIMAHDPARGPLLVICPLAVREVWLTWLRRRFPGEDISTIEGKTYDPTQLAKPIVVGHYDILSHWQSQRKLGTLIFDEAHVLSNPDSRRSVAASFIALRAAKVIALTGTPLWNKTSGLFTLLATLEPGAWGSRTDFLRRYCNPQPSAYGWVYDGTSHEGELKTRLSEVILHRTWQEVASNLVPSERRAVVASLTVAQRLEIDIAAELMRKANTHRNMLGAMARYRKALAEIKMPIARELALEKITAGEPVVIWTWHKSVARALHQDIARRKHAAFYVSGDTTPLRREEIFAAWRRDGGALVITIPAGQVGIDLSFARHAVFAELDFTPALIAQAEMRTFAPSRPMEVSYVVADHDADKRVLATMQAKIETSDRVGVPAAEAALDVLRNAFSLELPDGDLARLADDLLASGVIG